MYDNVSLLNTSAFVIIAIANAFDLSAARLVGEILILISMILAFALLLLTKRRKDIRYRTYVYIILDAVYLLYANLMNFR